MLDRMSVEELRTGVEVRQASGLCPLCPLRLFGVLGKELAEWTTMAMPGTALDSFVAGDEMLSGLTSSGVFFFGSLFLVFRGAPERSFTLLMNL